ncbi:BQ2448_5504 [Microbotryum intermedium]|uniref:BQ2448_5504 protein n=1 Tax=Microbotryum intermedium TaxID=269621 RepID=A0A238F799_9BASI|nr:BQ2448_5504 [Microbotryum intermedium]
MTSTHSFTQTFKTSLILNYASSIPPRRLFSTSLLRSDPNEPSTSTLSSTEENATTSTNVDDSTIITQDEHVSSNSSSSFFSGRGYRAWLKGDGAQYRHGIKGSTNWIGETPFPLNPTFNPLPPVSEYIKTKVHHAYLGNLQTNPNPNTPTPTAPSDKVVIRALSAKFGISMTRIRAIIRLKELEQEWKKAGIVLQTNFRNGMESYLGVKTPLEQGHASWRGKEITFQGERSEQITAKRKAGFEMIDVEGGEQSVFLPLLQHVPTRNDETTNTTGSATRKAEAHKSKPIPKIKIVQASRPGRPRFSFENVTGTEVGAKLAKTYDPKKTKRGNRKRVV